MAQNGTYGNQAADAATSDGGHTAPPTTVAFSLTSAGPYGNAGSSAGNMETVDASGVGKNLIPDLNKENKPRPEAKVEVAAADADADADANKGKSEITADDATPNVNIGLERESRKRMKGVFRALRDVLPHVPQKADKVTLLGEAITYIRALREKVARLGKQALARQAASRGEASSSSSSSTLTAQGMVALQRALDGPRGWGGVLVPPAAPALPALSSFRCQTRTAPNVVLTVANDSAYISVCAPRRANTLTMVTSVMDNQGIEVITAQVSSDRVRALLMIYAHVTRIDGENRRSSVEVYQRAVSEIIFRLHNNNN